MMVISMLSRRLILMMILQFLMMTIIQSVRVIVVGLRRVIDGLRCVAFLCTALDYRLMR